MARYLSIANSTSSKWNQSLAQTGYEAEIQEHWERVARGEKFDDICADIGARIWKRGIMSNTECVLSACLTKQSSFRNCKSRHSTPHPIS
jgi:hypothetical protein